MVHFIYYIKKIWLENLFPVKFIPLKNKILPMSIHINAKENEIAKIVLMPGDPLRAKFIAEKMLDKIKLVNTTRNVFFYTGVYKGVPITIGASGMGCPSIGIYSYELYSEYNVECIIRIGTAGGYSDKLDLFDVVNTDKAFSESTYAKCAFDYDEIYFPHQGRGFDIINDVASNLGMEIQKGNIHSSDVFYRSTPSLPDIAAKNNCLAVEMEAFALFANAKHLNKMAASLLTISDIISTRKSISAEQRERSLENMIKLSLESSLEIYKNL
jgi:purine-nucleoside phosphorylase